MSAEADAVEPITGKYVYVDIEGVDHRVYFEENGPGDGTPLLCQHTAGCNNQEWRDILTDEYRVIAYDLPSTASPCRRRPSRGGRTTTR